MIFLSSSSYCLLELVFRIHIKNFHHRLHENFATNKNKGFVFVKFANQEQASQELSELKTPIVCCLVSISYLHTALLLVSY